MAGGQTIGFGRQHTHTHHAPERFVHINKVDEEVYIPVK
jgi:hypothetical protein